MREVKRISEFSRHSLNFRETRAALSSLLDKYDLSAEFMLGELATPGMAAGSKARFQP